ncbi:MAG: BNR-4 repeat-containing protein [Thermogutta sp.]
MHVVHSRLCSVLITLVSLILATHVNLASERDTGYRGIWFTLGQRTEFGDKYSGGLGTYTANHVPIAIYCEQVNKTFFVYGGAKDGQRYLLNMVSYFDHSRGVVPRPTIVHDKKGVDDPHDNAALAIDPAGNLWVFISGRARVRQGFIYRSKEPYSIDDFELIKEGEMTYPQPWWIPEQGFLYLFTKYTRGRELYFNISPDGIQWAEDTKFAGMGGHYQTSGQKGCRVFTAFNYHPNGNVDRRTNLYYIETNDYGKTWKNVQGETLSLPLVEAINPALVRDYEKEGRLVYIHDLDLDLRGYPVILYTTAASYKPGPEGDPRYWTIAHWNGEDWEFSEVTQGNHNYSTGALYIEGEIWRIIGPTERGPQPVGAGGEIAIWMSQDQGKTWQKVRDVTVASAFNHNYVRRPVNAHNDFYAFWADGNPESFSPSCLYFCTRDGRRVFRLPYVMDGDEATPELLPPIESSPASTRQIGN